MKKQFLIALFAFATLIGKAQVDNPVETQVDAMGNTITTQRVINPETGEETLYSTFHRADGKEVPAIVGTEVPVSAKTSALGSKTSPTRAAAQEKQVVTSGYIGDDALFTMYDDYSVVISGTGYIYHGNGLTSGSSGTSFASNCAQWLEYYKSFQSIVIEEGITGINTWSFAGCSSLVTVYIPSSVEWVNEPFAGCTSLKTIEVSPENPYLRSVDNVLYNADQSTLYAYPGGKESSSFSVPSSVRYISDRAFAWSFNLTSVSIPSSVSEICSDAFQHCNNLKNLSMANGVKTIGSYAFRGCSSLTTINLPYSLTRIEGSAFQNCSSLTSINIPSSVTSIDSYAFSNCSSLTSLSIPNSVTSIGYNILSGCSQLSYPVYTDKIFVKLPESYSGHYNVPDGIETIVGGAFDNCWNITSVTVPNSVTDAAGGLFYYCSSIEGPIYNDKSFFYLPLNWQGEYEIPSGIETINSYAFWGCTGLTSVAIPEGVTTIGMNAFHGCDNLQSIQLPSSIRSICESAFYRCPFETVIIPEGITTLSSYAFHGCDRLQSVEIPASVKRIEQGAFWDCPMLNDVINHSPIPQSLRKEYEWYDDRFCTYGTLHVPEGTKEAYQAAEEWNRFNIVDDLTWGADVSNMDYALYFDEAQVRSNSEVELPLLMKNAKGITYWQADLVLPEGVSVATDMFGDYDISLSTERTEDYYHSISAREQADGSIRIICKSSTNQTFSGSDGEVATIKLSIGDLGYCAALPVSLRNVQMVEPNETPHNPADLTGKLLVNTFWPGDVNDDGTIDGLDLVAIVNFILGVEIEGNIAQAADINGDGNIDGVDYVAAVNLILNPSQKAQQRAAKHDDAASLTLEGLSIENFTLQADGIITADICLDVALSDQYTFTQFDLQLPDGWVVADYDKAEGIEYSHSLVMRDMEDGLCRVLVASSSNQLLQGGAMIHLTLQAEEPVAGQTLSIGMNNQLLVMSDTTTARPEAKTFSLTMPETTAIETIGTLSAGSQVFNLHGQKLNSADGMKGIVVIGNQKVMM